MWSIHISFCAWKCHQADFSALDVRKWCPKKILPATNSIITSSLKPLLLVLTLATLTMGKVIWKVLMVSFTSSFLTAVVMYTHRPSFLSCELLACIFSPFLSCYQSYLFDLWKFFILKTNPFWLFADTDNVLSLVSECFHYLLMVCLVTQKS